MSNKKSKRKFYMILFGEIFIVLLIATLFFVDFDSIFEDQNISFIEPNPPCDLRKQTCEVVLDEKQKVALQVNPKGIPLMKPLSFNVFAQGVKSDTIEIKIYALNMEMGKYKLTLHKVSSDRFEGKQILPSCIVGGMIWNADITSSYFNGKGVRFTFKTDI